jgi:hypothetical protein
MWEQFSEDKKIQLKLSCDCKSDAAGLKSDPSNHNIKAGAGGMALGAK